jgi:hypothetical protein
MSIPSLKKRSLLILSFAFAAQAAPAAVFGDDKIIARYTLPFIAVKDFSGISNIKSYDETPYDVTGKNELPFNPSGIDPEGLVRTRAGEFWIVE